MSEYMADARSGSAEPREEVIAEVLIDDVRHHLVWIHNDQRTVSVLVDRPAEGSDRRPRVIATLLASEGKKEVDALVREYQEHHVECPASERSLLRLLEPADLVSPGRDS